MNHEHFEITEQLWIFTLLLQVFEGMFSDGALSKLQDFVIRAQVLLDHFMEHPEERKELLNYEASPICTVCGSTISEGACTTCRTEFEVHPPTLEAQWPLKVLHYLGMRGETESSHLNDAAEVLVEWATDRGYDIENMTSEQIAAMLSDVERDYYTHRVQINDDAAREQIEQWANLEALRTMVEAGTPAESGRDTHESARELVRWATERGYDFGQLTTNQILELFNQAIHNSRTRAGLDEVSDDRLREHVEHRANLGALYSGDGIHAPRAADLVRWRHQIWNALNRERFVRSRINVEPGDPEDELDNPIHSIIRHAIEDGTINRNDLPDGMYDRIMQLDHEYDNNAPHDSQQEDDSSQS